jgi:hypothetical protein
MAEDRLLVRFCNVWPIHEIYELGLTQYSGSRLFNNYSELIVGEFRTKVLTELGYRRTFTNLRSPFLRKLENVASAPRFPPISAFLCSPEIKLLAICPWSTDLTQQVFTLCPFEMRILFASVIADRISF